MHTASVSVKVGVGTAYQYFGKGGFKFSCAALDLGTGRVGEQVTLSAADECRTGLRVRKAAIALLMGCQRKPRLEVQCSLRTTAIQILAIPDRRQIGVQP